MSLQGWKPVTKAFHIVYPLYMQLSLFRFRLALIGTWDKVALRARGLRLSLPVIGQAPPATRAMTTKGKIKYPLFGSVHW